MTFCGLRFAVSHEKPHAKGPYFPCFSSKKRRVNKPVSMETNWNGVLSANIRGDEWSIKIFNSSQNFTFARFARKI